MSDEWVMVPREASEAMIRAGYSAPTVFGVRDMANTYRAMLAAAPDASQRNREADRARYIVLSQGCARKCGWQHSGCCQGVPF